MSKLFGERYEVLERIGAGGMAIVYKAKDLLLNRVVTIKVLREQFVSDEDFIRRFRREAQSAASLTHPNIVSIYDVGKDGETEYIVMEYVEGRNLKEIIREFAPLSTDQTINLARQIASAIQNAHEHHIIHRDIKPHNILVTNDGQAKVTDFGIARAVSSATVTHTGDIVGSVHYLSPEQAKGLPSNEQSDIYSFGIVLYELLTGKVPYDGETPITIALKHLQEQPVPPSKLNPRIEKEVEAVIMRAISKSPETRYASIKDLLTDLDHIQAGRPITPLVISGLDGLESTQIHKGMSDALGPIKPNEPVDKISSSETKKKNRRRWIIGGLILLLVMIVGGIGLRNYLVVGSTKVPNIVGKSQPIAEDFLKQAKLTLDPNVTYEFNATVEKDLIIKQDPIAETAVKANRKVTIVVSKGVDKGTFPDVTTGRLPKDTAATLISNSGFTGTIIYKSKPSDEPKDVVIEQDPAPNSSWAKNGRITLTLSTGPEQRTIYMPNVIGMTSTKAKETLEQNKLIVKIETQDSTNTAVDVVISTSPKPGESLLQGSEVTIVVSRGPGPLAETKKKITIGNNVISGDYL